MEEQLELLKSFMAQLTETNHDVFVGGDFNHRLTPTPESIGTDYIISPPLKVPTTCKERGAMQTQEEKINKKDSGSKDCVCCLNKEKQIDCVKDCRVRTLYKDGKSFCSYALNAEAAERDESLVYPHLLQCPDYLYHFPDHFVVEVFF